MGRATPYADTDRAVRYLLHLARKSPGSSEDARPTELRSRVHSVVSSRADIDALTFTVDDPCLNQALTINTTIPSVGTRSETKGLFERFLISLRVIHRRHVYECPVFGLGQQLLERARFEQIMETA